MLSDQDNVARPSLWLALVPVVALISLLAINVIIYGDSATGGPNQVALIMAAALAGVIGWSFKLSFGRMLRGICDSLNAAMPAILILLMIGALSGTWMLAGIVPAMITYGLAVLEPSYFLVACVLICAIVSLATGSSWSTVATVGIALIGIGEALGASRAMTAGAIISGAYFGDKLSPLSDTTNLASAMANADLVTHIRHMLWTTVPSILITLGLFAYLGATLDATAADPADVQALSDLMHKRFNLSLGLFLVPVAVVVMVVMKVDALVALFVGALLGGLVAIFFQPQIVREVAGEIALSDAVAGWPEFAQNGLQWLAHSYAGVVNAMFGEISIGPDLTEIEATAVSEGALASLSAESRARVYASDLLSAGGMHGMLGTIWLIVCAMCFGGVMEACGLLKRITDALVSVAKSTGSLIATTAGTCLFMNVTASDQYLAIVVPGRMFRETYEERGLAPENLSRALEDSGTVTSVLVPWNTCGAVQAGVLGVLTFEYAGYCFFNYLSPLMTIAVGFLGIGITRLSIAIASDDNSDQ